MLGRNYADKVGLLFELNLEVARTSKEGYIENTEMN